MRFGTDVRTAHLPRTILEQQRIDFRTHIVFYRRAALHVLIITLLPYCELYLHCMYCTLYTVQVRSIKPETDSGVLGDIFTKISTGIVRNLIFEVRLVTFI